MTSEPQVSVVIPTRNRNVEVRRAVASALHQTLSDIEVIVVDDGSLTPTAGTLGELASDPRVRVHRNPTPGGPSVARNLGTELAHAPFVAYLDSDDEWHPTKLARQRAAFEHAGDRAGLCLCGYEVIDGSVHRTRVPRPTRAGAVDELLDTRHEPLVTSCFFLPTAVVRAHGFDPGLGAYEDLDLAARVSRTHDVVVVREILVRKHVSRERQFSGERVVDDRRAFLAKYDDILATRPAVRERHELTIAAELARAGRRDDACSTLARIEHPSWLGRVAQRSAAWPGPLAKKLDGFRLAERFSMRGVAWRLRTARLRWPQ